MKQAIMGVGLVFTLILSVVTLIGIGVERNKEDELYELVSGLVYQSLEEYMVSGGSLAEIVEDNAGYFIEDDNVEYMIQQINEEKGLLEIKVKMEYINFGVNRTIDSTRAAVIEMEV